MKIKRVIHKKIPASQKAVGLAYNDRLKDPKHKLGTIEIDDKAHASERLIFDTYVHEHLHFFYPEIPEESILKMANRITRIVYKEYEVKRKRVNRRG